MERLIDRVCLLFLFDLGGQHSQLSDVAAWLRHLHRHNSFISAVYGPGFAAASAAQQQQLQRHLWLGLSGIAAPEMATIAYICVDHAPFWLQSFALRSMRRLSSAFYPLSPFHELPRRLQRAATLPRESSCNQEESRVRRLAELAEEYHRLSLLINNKGATGGLVGSFLGYSGRWGTAETNAFKRKERHKFVTVLLVDRTAKVRWHATGAPTEEAVLLLV